MSIKAIKRQCSDIKNNDAGIDIKHHIASKIQNLIGFNLFVEFGQHHIKKQQIANDIIERINQAGHLERQKMRDKGEQINASTNPKELFIVQRIIAIQPIQEQKFERNYE